MENFSGGTHIPYNWSISGLVEVTLVGQHMVTLIVSLSHGVDQAVASSKKLVSIFLSPFIPLNLSQFSPHNITFTLPSLR